MALCFGRRVGVLGYWHCTLVAVAFATALAPASGLAAEIEVSIDHAKLIKMPERVATVVIGNPLIADAVIQSGGLMVLTGKSYGATNIIALDRSGAVLVEHSIDVRARQEDLVIVYRGVDRETYTCAPACESGSGLTAIWWRSRSSRMSR